MYISYKYQILVNPYLIDLVYLAKMYELYRKIQILTKLF